MSYDNNPKRFWFSCRQVCVNGVRYLSGWTFGDDLEAAKNSAVTATKRARELCPKSFTPSFDIPGTVIEFSLVQNVPEDAIIETFSVTL